MPWPCASACQDWQHLTVASYLCPMGSVKEGFHCLSHLRGFCSRCSMSIPGGSAPAQSEHKQMLLCYKLCLLEAGVGDALWNRQSQDRISCWSRSRTQTYWFSICHTKYYCVLQHHACLQFPSSHPPSLPPPLPPSLPPVLPSFFS